MGYSLWLAFLGTGFSFLGTTAGSAMVYLFRDDMLWKTISVLFVNIALMGGVQVFGVLALIPIYLYNGTQGKKMKWLFYGFYPVHLLALFLIKMILS